jgi:integrase
LPRAKNKDKPKERDGVLEITPNYFRLRWREPDPANPGKTQRRIEFFHGTRKEAIDERIRLQGLALGGKSKPRRKTLQDLADEFMANRKKKGRRSRTLEFHDDNLRVRIIPGLGATSLIDRITPEMCEELLKSLRAANSKYGRPYSKESLGAFLRTMNAMFNYAKKEKYIEANPAADIRVPDLDDDPSKPPDITQIQNKIVAPVLTPVQRQQLILVAVDDEFYVAICLAIATGKRRGEILGIKWTDIDWKTGIILIYKSVQRIRGQGIKAGPLKGKRNGEKLVSFVVVGPEMLELLRQHREQQQRVKDALGKAYHDEGWVFPRHDGKMWGPKTFSNHVKKLYAKLGLPEILAEKLTLHNLRNDYTTARFDRGDDIKDIQFDLDHENVITTWGYNHDTVERKKKAALENESELRFPPLWCAGQHATVDPAI